MLLFSIEYTIYLLWESGDLGFYSSMTFAYSLNNTEAQVHLPRLRESPRFSF